MWILPLLLAVLVGLAVFCAFTMLTLIVTFCEKRYVWQLEPLNEAARVETSPELPAENPYQPPSALNSDLPLTPFATSRCHELETLGYQHLGSYRDAKHGIYQIRCEAWISSDRYVLAMVESGSLMAMPVSNLSLLTLSNRQVDSSTLPLCVHSLTSEKAFDPNIGGMRHTMLFRSASALEADQLHRQRLAFVRPYRFSEDALTEYRHFCSQEAKVGFERGVCRFVDQQQNVWLPTFTGGFRIFAEMHLFIVSRRIYSDRWRLKHMLRASKEPE